CGIFGAVFDRGEPAVDRALAVLHDRGPDAEGTYRASGVVFGHRRLSILDLSDAARQPMTSADGKAVVVFNGEIFNHHELRDQLAARGRRFRTRSDTEVIVEGYREHGASFIERLDGMFALGIYDIEQRTLVLARDRTGKKPLFYSSHENGALRFASSARALFASGVDPEIDERALSMLLA